MDLGTPLRGMQDDSMDGGGRECLEHILEVEQCWKNYREKKSVPFYPGNVRRFQVSYENRYKEINNEESIGSSCAHRLWLL